MNANRIGLASAGVCAAAALAAATVPATTRADEVLIDRLAGAGDVKHERQVWQDLSPLPGENYRDFLHVFGDEPVTVAGGDTVRFRVRLTEPLRFRVSPEVALERPHVGRSGEVGLQLTMQVAGDISKGGQNHPLPDPAFDLIDPRNARLPDPQGDFAFGSYTTDWDTGEALYLRTGVSVSGTNFLPDPDRPSLIAGFEGAFDLPAAFPRTTFDGPVTMSLFGYVRAEDPPPQLVEVVSAPHLAADANGDGQVDVSDLGVVATNFDGPPSPTGRPGGDFNGDGTVDVADLGLLATHFGAGTGTGASTDQAAFAQAAASFPNLPAVPEPAGLGLLAVGGFGVLAGRRRQAVVR